MEERHAIASEDADLFFSFLLSRDANAREREKENPLMTTLHFASRHRREKMTILMSISQFVEHLRFHSSDYLWYLTILVSCLTLILIVSIFFESKLLLTSPPSSQSLFFQSTTSFFLHCLFNTSSFARNFTFALNARLRRAQVSIFPSEERRRTFSLQDSLRIESVQFANVHIRQLFEDKTGEAPKKLVKRKFDFGRRTFFSPFSVRRRAGRVRPFEVCPQQSFDGRIVANRRGQSRRRLSNEVVHHRRRLRRGTAIRTSSNAFDRNH